MFLIFFQISALDISRKLSTGPTASQQSHNLKILHFQEATPNLAELTNF